MMEERSKEQINAFLRAYDGVYAPSTHVELTRRLKKQLREIKELRAVGRITSSDYSDFTADDVKEFGVYLRNRGLKQSGIAHELTALGNLCRFHGSNAVDVAKTRYPLIFYSPPTRRLPPLTKSEYNALIAHLEGTKAPWSMVRAGAAVALALGAGLRPIEIQHTLLSAVDLDDGIVYISITKGGLTYGEPREAPIRPTLRPILRHYISLRSMQPPTTAQSNFLFCNSLTGLPLETNTLRSFKSRIEKATGVTFDYRKLRRTYAQMALDGGADLSSVSVVLGHNNTRTTESAYGRLRPDVAVADVANTWGEYREVIIGDKKEKIRYTYEK